MWDDLNDLNGLNGLDGLFQNNLYGVNDILDSIEERRRECFRRCFLRSLRCCIKRCYGSVL
ncbi:MAG TPA: hypothetical protein VN421_10170 [Pseudoflavonifractor sp.]|nr:hypothetical protein [Pseudoflavonifractor sp.]